MKSLIVLVVLTVFMPCMSVAATWDDMLKDEPAVEQSVSTGIPLVNILGKPVAVPPSLKPSYVERVQKVAPNLASMCPGFSSHSQSLGDWTILSTPPTMTALCSRCESLNLCRKSNFPPEPTASMKFCQAAFLRSPRATARHCVLKKAISNSQGVLCLM